MINRSNSNIETSSTLISTHPKSNQQEKNSKPLRFRSFDAFYQEYNRKNSPGDSKNLNPANKTPIKNTSVKDKIELLKASTNKESDVSKTAYVLSSDYYNIRGRVKKLCEMFQKCDDQTQFFSGLSDSSSEANIQEPPISPESLLPSSVQTESAEIKPIDVLSPIETHVKLAGSKDALKLASSTVSNDPKQSTNAELHQVVDTNAGPLGDPSPLIAKPGSSTGLDEAAMNTNLISNNLTEDPVIVEKNPGTSSPSALSPSRSASFEYASPTKPAVVTRSVSSGERPSGDNPINGSSTPWIYPKFLSRTKTTLNTPRTELAKYGPLTCGMVPQDIDIVKHSMKNSQSTTEDNLSSGMSESESLPRQSSNTSLKSQDEALIDQVIDRIMDDRDFCNSFFDKLESFNLRTESESSEFHAMIDELQRLFDDDDQPENEISEQAKKAFDWYFNQPQVFDLEFTERNDRSLVTTIEDSDSSEDPSLNCDEPPSKSIPKESPRPSNRTESTNWLSRYNNSKNPAVTRYRMANNLNNSFRENSTRGYKSDFFKKFDWFSIMG